ncbi:hypothetical protein [Cryobacterium zhongshanensis]|uniref:Uncharacterized protein n=1 Tax=Cryobacterium zhongshanensis TaxID=2928153 RepID=A0AA41UH74_9MICO|nr:hypothetical protein [Cryobacterium zhongshanensis]MCI4659615.1 hypothetical protein [Cryobacterium zhongshanensis]
MTTSRYDAKDDQPYGTCQTCGIEIATETMKDEHFASTMKDDAGKTVRRSHSILITNPGRADRVESAVGDLVDTAITDALDELEGLIADEHITREEATAAIARWSEFADEWSRE